MKATGNVTIGEYPLYFIPFDEDILSLELDRSFKVLAPPLCGLIRRTSMTSLVLMKIDLRKPKWMATRVRCGILHGQLRSFRYLPIISFRILVQKCFVDYILEPDQAFRCLCTRKGMA